MSTPASPLARQPFTMWQAGWYRFAHHCPSPNFGARPDGTAIELVVLHSISLPPGQYGGGHVQRFFTNQLDWTQHPYFQTIEGQQVSAHFFIERTGALWQFVSCDDRAWHAGVSSYTNHRGDRKDSCNDFSVGIELEGVPGTLFEDAQYESLFSLYAALCSQYPVSDCAGHEHIAPGRKDDPGSGFDWHKMLRINPNVRYTTASV